MNEEEKKAVKFFYNLRATIDESNMLFDEEINVKHGKETIKQITTILNLIKKLQEENEELKLKEKCRIIGKYGEVEIHDVINRVLSNDYIPKQKIKSKIEKLEKKMKNENNEKVLIQLHKQRRILQELLEKKCDLMTSKEAEE